MPEIIQPSFAKGELSPELYGRVDTAAYRVGLATAKNAIVHTYGGISRRPGMKFLAPVGDHTAKPRLIPFIFKTTDKYILEFGNQYMRVFRDDGNVLNAATTITGATQADPVVITASGHGLSNGDQVYISSVGGMTEINGRWFTVAGVSGATFELTHHADGTDIDGTLYTTYTTGGEVAEVYEISTPYVTADLYQLNFTQSADVMTITHPSYLVRELTRTGHTSWTLSELSLGPNISSPSDQIVTVNTSGSQEDYYRVTAIDRDTLEESLPGLNDTEKTITGATQASPVVVTAAAHGYANGDEVQINSVVGMTELNGNRYIVANKATNTFELTDENGDDIDGTGFTAYSSAGIARQTFVKITNGATTRDNTISWTAVDGAVRYSLYRRDNGIYGLIGETEDVNFTDDNISPDTSESPPFFRHPFRAAADQPGAVGYFEQRRVFGGSLNSPDTSEFSQTGAQSNFNKTIPLKADDAITATLNSQQVNEIKHYIALADLIILTTGGEWRVSSGPDSGFAPDTIRVKPQTYYGSSSRPPVISGNTILFLEANNRNVRSLGYSFQRDGYISNQLNILATHLVDGLTITDWAFSTAPEGRLYMVRSDGNLLTMSFDQEQEVIAWTTWETDGDFESVEVLRHGGTQVDDKIYFVVKRVINGNTVRYVEMAVQEGLDDIKDAFRIDSGLTLDVPVTITGSTAADPVVITAASHGFSDGDAVDISDIIWEVDVDSVHNETQPDQLNGKRYIIANKTANTFELTDSNGDDVDGSAFNAYVSGGEVRKAITDITGLDHLEGESVQILADGSVEANKTVSGGGITLARKASRVHIGLKYITDIETLNIEPPQGTVQGYDIKISKVVIKFFKSRSPFVGPNSDELVEMKQREFEDYHEPTSMLTGQLEVELLPDWNTNGRVLIRQFNPLPMTILAIIPSVETGETL